MLNAVKLVQEIDSSPNNIGRALEFYSEKAKLEGDAMINMAHGIHKP